ncbi:S41 family peptidase [Alteromonas gilva]|uniref:Tricorn protease homolog n=1 Tax=Alteromonas gilva TaxID=2987522 RepID=A0ABT5L3R1_9ALTE|nr:S41 family peptidase [Alteromonas gilva]MDC8831508.1 S41 family peptidase [Alteromonas gilva]
MINRTLLGLGLLFVSLHSVAKPGYFRDPDLHDNTVVFTAEGDLWLHQLDTRQTRRLTTNTAYEKQAAISNDGTRIAFTADYDGTTEIYVIPIGGGVAKRVTFENSYVFLQEWTADGHILYSANNRVGPTGNWTLKTVDPENLNTKDIPLADAVEGSVDGDSGTLYFTQFGLQVTRDNARYYRGGAQGELWRFNPQQDDEATQLTGAHDASASEPMFYDGKLYFISNKNGNANLWVMSANGKNLKAVTNFQDYPVQRAKLDNGRVIFQHGADLKIYDSATDKVKTLDITLSGDFPHLRDKWVTKPTKYLTSADFNGKKKQVVLTARGQLAVASIDGRRLIEIDTPAASRSRKAILSHDGEWVYAINDSSGEMEIWQFAADGSPQRKQLTNNGAISRWQLVLSPDGKKIAYDDFNGDLWLLDIASGESEKLYSGQNEMNPYADIVWSKDSNLLAITTAKMGDERQRIYLHDITNNKGQVLTSDKYNSYSPAFSPDQHWLYFLSDREFSPSTTSPWGDRNMGTSFDRRTQIFAYALKADADFPFQQPDELADEEEEDTSEDTTYDTPAKDSDDDNDDDNKADTNEENSDADAADATESPLFVVDWQGLTERLWQVPVKAGNYRDLSVNKRFLYVIDSVSEPGSRPVLKSVSQNPKPKILTFVSGIGAYRLNADGDQMLVLKQSSNNDQIYIVPAQSTFPADTSKHTANVNDWKLLISPQQEWQQLFHDAWLMHRDYFYDKNMRGVDWQAIKQKYQPLLSRITDRDELNDLLGMMTGELNVLHSQVYGGDFPSDSDRPTPSSLGANLVQTSEGVQIASIYQFDREVPSKASPLLKPGTDAQEGDVIISINEQPVDTLAALNNHLLNQQGKQVILGLKRGDETFKTVVYPVSTRTDARLRYQDWTTRNRQKVQQASDNIGYLHLYAMGANDVSDFAREFYAAYQNDGLIIDVRRNRGGNVDSWLLEKLLRKVWMFWTIDNGLPSTNMQQTFRGHLVVLADQQTYSDGETFTAGVKALELGPVIGKQTAGAGIWLRGRNRLADNGMARVAELPVFAADGRWITEGLGITPDIEVTNLPHATYKGEDAQLDAAINYLQKRIKQRPVKPLTPKPYPAVDEPADDINR